MTQYTKGNTVWHLTQERCDFSLYERCKHGVVRQMQAGKKPHPRIAALIRNEARRNATVH